MHAAEQRGIRVLIDLVVNHHISNQHPWFPKAHSARKYIARPTMGDPSASAKTFPLSLPKTLSVDSPRSTNQNMITE
jgi:glycosidase